MEVDWYLGVDETGEVHGAYALRWQFFWLRGEKLLGAHYGFPSSEGIINSQYVAVGASVLRDATRRCEYLYTLGAQGRTGSLFRVARPAGWMMEDVPFLFRIIHAGRFVRELPLLQGSKAGRVFATVGTSTGLAQIAGTLFHAGLALRHRGSSTLRSPPAISLEVVDSLAEVADEIWSQVRSQYEFCVVRDSEHVEPCFPPDRRDLRRLVVRREGRIIGWAVVIDRKLSRLRPYVGDATPGFVVDAFGETRHAREIAQAVAAHLTDHGVDIIVTNTSHREWVNGYKCAGFASWRSQFPLMVSRSLARRIGNFRAAMDHMHLSRADADGIHDFH